MEVGGSGGGSDLEWQLTRTVASWCMLKNRMQLMRFVTIAIDEVIDEPTDGNKFPMPIDDCKAK